MLCYVSEVHTTYCALRNWIVVYFKRIISGDYNSNCCVSGGYSIEGFGLYANQNTKGLDSYGNN